MSHLLQAISMLPRKLCEELCSLNPNEVSDMCVYADLLTIRTFWGAGEGYLPPDITSPLQS